MHIIITREMMEKVLYEKFGLDAEKVKQKKRRKGFTTKHANSIIDFAWKVPSYLSKFFMT